MNRVNNGKIIRRIARENYFANNKRNLFTIFAIMLTTFLLAGLLGIGGAYWESIQTRSMRMEGMKYDIELTEPTEKQVAKVKQMPNVQSAGVEVKCGIIEAAQGKSIHKTQLFWLDHVLWRKQCIPALAEFAGTYPAADNEVMLSTQVLKEMGIKKPKLGMKIQLGYYYLTPSMRMKEGALLQQTFTLSGYFTDYTGKGKGFVSRAFYTKSGARQTDFTQGKLKIALRSPFYSEADILSMQKKFDLENKQVLIADTESLQQFIKVLLVLSGLLVMIVLSGYLFIYSTMYISVAQDIRLYGQLKTLGTTEKQLRRIVMIQTVWNGGLGISLGLLLSSLVILKIITGTLKMIEGGDQLPLSAGFMLAIFAVAALFSGLTVYIGSRKPSLIAARCSPIEAMRFNEAEKGGRLKLTKGFVRLAWRNIFRDRRRAIVIFGSFVASFTLLFTVNVIMKQNEAKEILAQTYTYDLQILNETALENPQEIFSEEKVTALKNVKGVKNVRVVYSTAISVPYQKAALGKFYQALYQSRYSPGNYQKDIAAYQKDPHVNHDIFSSRLIGIDQASFKKLKTSVSEQDFLAGKVGLIQPFFDIAPKEAVGKTLTFSFLDKSAEKQEHQIKIAAVAASPAYFAGGYSPQMIISTQQFKRLVPCPIAELVMIDYDQPLTKKTETAIQQLFNTKEQVSFDSKLSRYEEMLPNERRVHLLGSSIGLILALLAIFNYVNMMAASIQNRKKEFAILNAIGMTGNQLNKMLMFEGVIYAGFTLIISFLLSLPMSYLTFQSLDVYGLAFQVPLLRDGLFAISMIALCGILPLVLLRFLQKGSITENLTDIVG